jgi:hypothetical protein
MRPFSQAIFLDHAAHEDGQENASARYVPDQIAVRKPCFCDSSVKFFAEADEIFSIRKISFQEFRLMNAQKRDFCSFT